MPHHSYYSAPRPLLFSCSRHLRALHSFPTRRSSDLCRAVSDTVMRPPVSATWFSMATTHSRPAPENSVAAGVGEGEGDGDRKSTRLNSSHVKISYAVFCLKKKNRLRTSRMIATAKEL